MMEDLQPILNGIASALGVAAVDIESEHGRWDLYQPAIEKSLAVDLLHTAVALEPDDVLATSVVLHMLEQVSNDKHDVWIDQLGRSDNQAYCRKRARDIRILRSAATGSFTADDIASEIASCSNWLLLRLANCVPDHSSLIVISQEGRTKRSRHTARERLRKSDYVEDV